MNKQEVIEKIKNLEGLTILDKTINFDSEMIPKKEVFNIINQIDEPEKPVIPQFIADWLEVCKENLGFGLSSAMSHSTSAMEKQPNKVKGWFNLKDNQETFAKAWLYGYEVEKEKFYTAKLKSTGEYLHYDSYNDKFHHTFAFDDVVKKTVAYHFTKDELVKYSAWKNDNYDINEVKNET